MHLKPRAYIAIGSFLFLSAVVLISVYVAGQNQDIRNRASDGAIQEEPYSTNVIPLIDPDGDGAKLDSFEEESVPSILKSLDEKYGIEEIEKVFED